MKRSHKRILIFFVLLLAVLLLAGCGGIATDPETGQTIYKPGIFEPIAAPLRAMVVFFNNKLLAPLGITYSWGWAIILAAVAIRLLLLPLSIRQTRSMKQAQIKTKALQPELDRLKKKYGKDKQRYQQEQMKLYQEHGITSAQMAGCLPTLLQMPILFAFYYAIIGLVAGGLITGEPWYFIPDISLPSYREGFSWLTQGLSLDNLGGSLQYLISPGVWPYLVLPILLAITQFVMVKTGPSAQAQPGGEEGGGAASGVMGQMTWLMTGMFVFFALQVPAALSLYWVVGNSLAMAQQIYVNKQQERWEKEVTLKPILVASESNPSANGSNEDEPPAPQESEAKKAKSEKPTPTAKSGTRRKRRRRR